MGSLKLFGVLFYLILSQHYIHYNFIHFCSHLEFPDLILTDEPAGSHSGRERLEARETWATWATWVMESESGP